MSNERDEPVGEQSLRMRAIARLTGHSDPKDTRANSAAALAILHELASSPATAADSLKLLHELQVHQVELDLQNEELTASQRALEDALREQTILFLNRRGHSRSLVCPDCGEAVQCKRCSVSLTLHRTDDTARCHLCNHQERAPVLCPSCRSPKVRWKGYGTQKVEAKLCKRNNFAVPAQTAPAGQ